MPYFPQINAQGVMVQRPYGAGHAYKTTVVELPCGITNVWGWRGMAVANCLDRPLGVFDISYSAITDAEVDVLHAFFVSMRGRWGEFSYLDPHGNLVPASENFADASWALQDVNRTPGQADPFGGAQATRITATGAGPLQCTVLPGGGASGFVLNASVWAKAASAGQQLTVAFLDSGNSVLSSTTRTLPNGLWVRAEHAATLTTNSPIRARMSGMTDVMLFGAQCVPAPGPGGYMKTPGKRGLYPKCRFDQDTFQPRYAGPNQNSLKLAIVEHN